MWSDLKKILTGNDKCIIIEDGKPKYVIISFAEYQQLQASGNDSIVSPERSAEENPANRELLEASGEHADSSISIEDLPF